MDEAKQRLQAIVRGRVQGVNFRYFTQRAASERGLSGWVRNRRDGSVELVAEGERGRLEELIAALEQGPPSASVSGIEEEWGEATGEFDSFRVRWTL